MQKFAALSGFVSTNAGGNFYPGVRREPRFLTPSRIIITKCRLENKFTASASLKTAKVLAYS